MSKIDKHSMKYFFVNVSYIDLDLLNQERGPLESDIEKRLWSESYLVHLKKDSVEHDLCPDYILHGRAAILANLSVMQLRSQVPSLDVVDEEAKARDQSESNQPLDMEEVVEQAEQLHPDLLS